MKRIIIYVFLILMTKSLFANVEIGGTAGGVSFGDLHLQSSYGWTVGVDLFSNFSIIYNGYKGSYSKTDTNSAGSNILEREYTHFVNMGKIQFLYPLLDYRFLVGGSAGYGTAQLSFRRNDFIYPEEKFDEKLSIAGLWAEFKYHYDQKFSLTASAGYVTVDDKGQLAGKNIGGPELKIGVTYALIGKNKRLY